MKKLYVLWILLCIVVCYFLIHFFSLKNIPQKILTLSPKSSNDTATPTSGMTGNVKIQKTLFVPYWTIPTTDTSISEYEQLVYFGISADQSGVLTNDTGYKNMDTFLALVRPTQKRLLGVRMLNSDQNSQILTDNNTERKIIQKSIDIAKEKGFDGIVLDFEISALDFDTVTKKVSDFEVLFANNAKQQHVQFYATMYGDTFFRLRPFSVARIAEASDGIMIMAYDFHKANGDPGPNFQLHDNQDDGYDFAKMIDQFAVDVPAEKTTVIFGMYGYDWEVNTQNQSQKTGVAVSDNTIQQKFLHTCTYKDCYVKNDNQSAETKITYIDNSNNNHIVWFEDMHSADIKASYLRSRGIGSIAYWAYSYF